MGYHQAGFTEIVGIDHLPQKNYPFQFIQADALKLTVNLNDFDLIHASPPCQAYSTTRYFTWNKRKDYPDLLPRVQKLLRECNVPYVIENVVGAPIRKDLLLCGTMFGRRFFRHRLFEIEPRWLMLTPPCAHNGTVKNGDYFCIVGDGHRNRPDKHAVATYCSKANAQEAMGMPWAYRYEIVQAVPPCYTEFIGKHMLKNIREKNGIHNAS